MPIEQGDVDAIVSEEQMNQFLGGQIRGDDSMVSLAPEFWSENSLPARQYALDRVLDYLRRKVPPIYWSDLADPTELHLVIKYGAAEHLYQLAMSTAQTSDVFAEQRRLWAEKFDEAISSIALTLNDGEELPSSAHGFTVGRN